MKAFIWSTVLSGVRSHSFQLLAVISLFIVGLAWLSANFSVRQPATLTLDIGLSGIRGLLVIMALFWVQDLIARDIERKTVMFALSYPVPRSHYLLGRFVGIAVLCALALAMMSSMLWLAVTFSPVDYQQLTPVHTGLAYFSTCFYLFVSVLVVVAFATVVAVLSTTPLLPLLLGIGFAILASSIGVTLDFVQMNEWAEGGQSQQLESTLQWASYMVPDLGRLDIRAWTLYGSAPSTSHLVLSLLMAGGYISVMLGIGVNRFQARQFS
jgi:Cu-processing system permease protein